MFRIASCIALSLLLAPARGAETADPAQALLEQARQWQFLERPLDGQHALDQLLRIAQPASNLHAEALTLQALGQLQSRQTEQARRTLARLRTQHPGYAGIARVERMFRLRGADSAALLRARALFQAGRAQEAYAAFDKLYQGSPPEGPLALEYWQVVARLPGDGWSRAQTELKRLRAAHPTSHRVRAVLASIYLLHPPLPQAVLDELQDLSGFDDSRGEAMALWRRALLQEGGNPPQASYRQYLQRAPDDQTVRSRMAESDARQRRQREQLADPGYRALLAAGRQLDASQLGAAEQSLRLAAARYGRDPQYLRSLGRLREKQGRYADAAEAYRRGQALGGDDWRQRLADARFGEALAGAREAMDRQDWPQARAWIESARQLRADDADVLLAEADWQAAQRNLPAARDYYWLALRRKPDSGRALAGLTALYLEQGKYEDADHLLAAMPMKQRAALGDAYRSAEAQAARARGDALRDKGQTEQAVPYLRQAVSLQPRNPWNRYALAGALLAAGQDAAGKAVLSELADEPSADPDSLYAYALFLSSRGEGPAALAALEKIPEASRTPGMAALQRRAWLKQTLALADAESARGEGWRARRRLEEAEARLAGDGALLADVARAWQRMGDPDRARTLMRDACLAQPTADNELAYAGLLLDQKRLAEAEPALAALARNGQRLSAGQRQTLKDLLAGQALIRAEQARVAGQPRQADDILRQAALAAPDNPRLQRALAEGDMASGRWDAARGRLDKILAARPDDDEARLALLDADIGAGRLGAARSGADILSQPKPGRDADFMLRVLSRIAALGDADRVDSELARLRAEGLSAPGVYLLAGERAQAHGQPQQAQALYREGLEASARQAAAAQPSAETADGPLRQLPQADAKEEGLHRAYAELLDKQSGKAWQGIDLLYRGPSDGTPGASQMTLWQTPLLLEKAAPGNGHYFFRGEAASVSAGSLDLGPGNDYTLNRFGSVAACAPSASPQTCAAAYGAQRARGVALGGGYESDDWRFDIGVTPLGFPVSNIVVGARRTGDLGPFGYKLALARRPLTSSLLSYAGVRDPYVGQAWGGVVATGLGGGLGYDKGGSFGVWSNFAYQQLTGENVDSNRKLTAMGGVYWRVVDEPDRLITAGVNTVNFWYRKNLGGFTFGQGGYYSPQRYNSLSLPLRYAARNERWSYFIRGAASFSSAREDASPFYPTRPDLQARAGNPFFGAGSGPGRGTALTGAFEYQLSPGVVLGGMLDLQRSQYYQPSRLLFYLRYQPDGAPRTLPFPVEPLQPYSEF
ncbi:BCSC C-terminal domain-containing protein [Chromobacterium violaceum]|uniref:cellulose synthase subunit BcsC-related outer membrane protein n=1 Tax=Chromobacterium violaceum TaxID=536 RepID=UPI001E55FB94|nr:cellulose synthase subunit BcsC-related outer membrane protein [Chromobacterium violaceum]MCD0490915.1 BCSC C-terminal domain-containing protein [Chromobacterium violaceum]